MLTMETLAKIRRMYHVQKKGFKTIARELNMSRNTVKKIIREDKTSQRYVRNKPILPVLGSYVADLIDRLKADTLEPKRRRRTARKLYQELCLSGFGGSYTTISTFVQKWKRDNQGEGKKVYIPLDFVAGEAFQFDWSEEEIKLNGSLIRVKAAHIRLCYSRLFLIIVYRNEQLEMVMDAHDKAFQFFGGVCEKGIYDNMKTAIQKVLIGKEREFNKRFSEMASHYLFEPIACTPAAGWEKGQVENQVQTGRRNFFTPLRCVNNLEDLNEQLRKECLEWAQKTSHPEFKEKSVWDIYQEEKTHLIAYRNPFEAYKIRSAVLSSYSLIHYQTNWYSADCDYVSEAVQVRIYCDKVVIFFEEKIIGQHVRSFERNQRIYEPWHYVKALERKPGALRNGAPFKHWKLPDSLTNIRKMLSAYSDGDKQFIRILLTISIHGLNKLDEACTQALEIGTYSADFIISYLNSSLSTQSLAKENPIVFLKEEPDDNCCCYNQLFLHNTLIKKEGDHHVA